MCDAAQGLSIACTTLHSLFLGKARIAAWHAGDVNQANGFSPFPGNINQIVMRLQPYAEQLAATGGTIEEFVNPKYKDTARQAFKKATRLECMMQDYPKSLGPNEAIGFTTLLEVLLAVDQLSVKLIPTCRCCGSPGKCARKKKK